MQLLVATLDFWYLSHHNDVMCTQHVVHAFDHKTD